MAQAMGEERSPARGPTITVTIPVFNSIRVLSACLDSVLAAMRHYGAAQLVLVDNGSTDGSYELMGERYADGASLLRLPGATISTLRNAGARLGTGELLSFIDSDCVVPADYFERAAAVLATVPAAATGSTYALPPHPNWIEATWDALHQQPGDGYVEWLNSGNFVCRRDAFEAVGGFLEELRTGEDAELCQRLWQHGYRIYEAHAVEAIHLGNPATLRAFFRKQVWHSLGMFGTFRANRLDKPVVMTGAHAAATLAAIGLLAGWHSSWAAPVALALLALMPALAVAYRVTRNRVWPNPLRAILLYFLYFNARAWAMLRLLGRRLRAGRATDEGAADRSTAPNVVRGRLTARR